MKFSKSDILVSSIVVVLCTALLGLYYNDINSALTSVRTKELGSIVFRKNTATRKPASSIRWERLQNLSKVYEGDTIRTSDASEAALNFDGGTSLDVFENSMLKINFAGPVQEFQYLGGTMSVGGTASGTDGTGGSGSTVVRVGESVINVGADALVSFSTEGKTLSVDVSSGEATVTNAAGTVTQIEKNQALTLNTESGETSIVEITLIPLKPSQNARLLDLQTDNKTDLSFVFNYDSAPTIDKKLTLSLSRASDFSVLEATEELTVAKGSSGPYTITTKLDEGVWFWRVRGTGGETSPSRRFSLSREKPVVPTLPVDRATFSYRKKLPAIRFSWRQSELASASVLEIASDKNFTTNLTRSRTNLSSLTVQTLKEGNWYWRVVPLYSHEIVSSALEPVVYSFSIQQRENMSALVPVMPTDGLLYQIQEITEKGYSFSWQPDAEALSYELLISKTAGASQSLARFTSTRPFIQLDASLIPFLTKEGTYYWSVRWIDIEGNVSPLSAPQRLTGIDGRIAMRLSYPIEGYSIADSLVSSTRFTWKTNVGSKTVFQLATDPLFKDLIHEEIVKTESLLGKEWKAGVYYWRLKAYNIDDSVFLETPPRMVRIVDPLKATRLLNPVPNTSFIIPKDETVRFLWEAVNRADYYRLQLFSTSSGITDTALTVPLYESKQLTTTSCEIPLGNLPDGRYRTVIQAFALDTKDSTRIIGYRSDDLFTFKQIVPVELVSPLGGPTIDGLNARRNGILFEWKAEDTPSEMELEITKDGSRFKIPFTYTAGMTHFLLSQLPGGQYEWTIRASIGNFNISSKTSQHFTVKAIPLLPPAKLLNPTDSLQFGTEDLSTSKSLRFTWAPVPGANRYKLTIYDTNSGKVVFTTEGLEKTEYVLKDLSSLDKGSFMWEVIPQNYWTDGKLEQDGQKSSYRFSIILPPLKLPATQTGGMYYGN